MSDWRDETDPVKRQEVIDSLGRPVFDPIPFTISDFYKDWELLKHGELWYVIPSDLATQGYWGNCRRSYSDAVIAFAAFDDFLERLTKAKASYKEQFSENGNPHDNETIKLIREIISAIGGVQHTSHSYIRGGKKSCRSEMEFIKSDADKVRGKIRELAQHLGVEY